MNWKRLRKIRPDSLDFEGKTGLSSHKNSFEQSYNFVEARDELRVTLKNAEGPYLATNNVG